MFNVPFLDLPPELNNQEPTPTRDTAPVHKKRKVVCNGDSVLEDNRPSPSTTMRITPDPSRPPPLSKAKPTTEVSPTSVSNHQPLPSTRISPVTREDSQPSPQTVKTSIKIPLFIRAVPKRRSERTEDGHGAAFMADGQQSSSPETISCDCDADHSASGGTEELPVTQSSTVGSTSLEDILLALARSSRVRVGSYPRLLPANMGQGSAVASMEALHASMEWETPEEGSRYSYSS
jgi:hypothetical protein